MLNITEKNLKIRAKFKSTSAKNAFIYKIFQLQ